MSRVFAAYSVGGLIGPALGAFGGIARARSSPTSRCVLAALPLVLPRGASRRAAARSRPIVGAPHARLLGRGGGDPVRLPGARACWRACCRSTSPSG